MHASLHLPRLLRPGNNHSSKESSLLMRTAEDIVAQVVVMVEGMECLRVVEAATVVNRVTVATAVDIIREIRVIMEDTAQVEILILINPKENLLNTSKKSEIAKFFFLSN